MIPVDARAIFAAIAIAHTKGGNVTGLYDHAQSRHLNLIASASGQTVNAIDLERKAKVNGTLPAFIDHSRSSHVHMTGENGKYTGYDYKTETHFNIEVTGDTAALYDHEQGVWTQYSA
ncbi:hypothetical protein OB03_01765 [Brevundimonas sp. GN22]|uniref:hypothetical protein n=1 Tax=Brevundimonas pishanensis TaxID=2896315 RepID=UPI001FA7E37D|nr:hypothetical protein [Brevundimonas pishanensis]